MYAQLPILLQLQEIDDKINKLESEKATIPTELQALEAELAKHRVALQAKSNTLEELQKDRRGKERQLSIQQAQLDRYKSQRLSVKTNREYTALESEITDLEQANSDTEDEILELMISIDESEDKIKAAREELETQEDIFSKKRDKFLAELKDLDQQIIKWNKERKVFLGKIDSVLMSRYDGWRKRRGSSMVAIIRGQSCGGCHLTLPPQLINEVRKAQDLHLCDSCGRILYWQNEDEIPEE